MIRQMPERREFHIGRVVAAEAGVVLLPAGLRAGRLHAFVEHQIVSQLRDRQIVTVAAARAGIAEDTGRRAGGIFDRFIFVFMVQRRDLDVGRVAAFRADLVRLPAGGAAAGLLRRIVDEIVHVSRDHQLLAGVFLRPRGIAEVGLRADAVVEAAAVVHDTEEIAETQLVVRERIDRLDAAGRAEPVDRIRSREVERAAALREGIIEVGIVVHRHTEDRPDRLSGQHHRLHAAAQKIAEDDRVAHIALTVGAERADLRDRRVDVLPPGVRRALIV